MSRGERESASCQFRREGSRAVWRTSPFRWGGAGLQFTCCSCEGFQLTPVDDPLEWSNLNKEKVAVASAMQREAAKRAAQDKKERDRAALEKQRADQAKAKADRQKKAQKQERRG